MTAESEDGSIQAPASSSMAAAAPAIFTVDSTNQGVVEIASTKELAMPANAGIASRPARDGETITIYATGLGRVQGSSTYPVRVAIGDVYADSQSTHPVSAGSGLFQVEVTVPENVHSGPAVPVHLEVTLPDQTTVWSNTVTVAIE